MLVHVGSFSLVLGCIASVLSADLTAGLLRWNVQTMAGGLVFVVAAAAISLFGEPVRLLTLFSRAAPPLVTVGCILLGVLPTGLWGVGGALVMAGFFAADLFTWFLNSELVARSGRTPFTVLARSAAVQWAAFVAGMACGDVVATVGGEPSWLFAVCAVLIVAEQALALTPIRAARLVDDRHDPLGEERVRMACDLLAARGGLTTREAEVLALLARGRSVPYIQEALGISQSTAKTHAHSIYRKLGVTSKQALLDLVDAAA